MEQAKGSTPSRKGKHLNRNERILIEGFLRAGRKAPWIAAELGRHRRTIEREVERGLAKRIDSELVVKLEYSADRAQDVHELNASAKGPMVKLKANSVSVEFIRCHIVIRKWSPEVVAARMKQKGMPDALCAKSIYNYIDQGWIPGVANETLWEKRTRRKQARKAVCRKPKKCPKRRKGIEERPEEVDARITFGHWEIDLVVGGKGAGKAALMTLVERKTRKMLIRKLKDRSQPSVLGALRSMERAMGIGTFKTVFRSITADNGTEFLDVESMEKSAFSKKMRTQMFYAHPYSSWERGSNENGNRLIRRFIAKGADIAGFSKREIKRVQDWINNYPRKILEFKTAEEMFIQELAV